MLANLDSVRAADIAVKFFEQYHSEIVVSKVAFDDNVWVVDLIIGIKAKQERQVRVDAGYGRILAYR